jgi:hypothetical protein
MRRICSQRLEGSRFGACTAALQHSPQRGSRRRPMKTGGSRERVGAMHLPIVFGWFVPGVIELHRAG